MRKITISTLLTLLYLAGTAQALRAQQTTEDASLPADSVGQERALTINEMRQQRGLTDTHNLFVPRGQWIFGGTASYSTHSNETYRFLVVEGIESKGYTFKVSPMIAYALRDNMAIGGRFIYSRSLLKLDKADLNLGREAVPEIIQSDLDITRAERELRAIVAGGAKREKMLSDFGELRKVIGGPGASDRFAARMVAELHATEVQ